MHAQPTRILPHATPAPGSKVNIEQLGTFDEIIDVRSPAEYAEDHIPGALSAPVLTDDQRARIGT